MTQPKFAPIAAEDEVRPAYRLAPPAPWRAGRPADLVPGAPATIAGGGVPGPDQGYALRLAELFAPRLVLAAGEHGSDVLAAAVAIALRRASSYGRAPVGADLELALELYGLLGDAPEDLVARRGTVLAGAGHDYARRRSIVASIPETTLRMSPAAVREARAGWRELLGA
ncbi:MAG TPA: hypothetical protein VND23_09865 [Acidimicrobiales bacterium]|nr:hypothetical protein [Acidimicrobiales bacterium]